MSLLPARPTGGPEGVVLVTELTVTSSVVSVVVLQGPVQRGPWYSGPNAHVTFLYSEIAGCAYFLITE